jgi:hypothetical protein
MSRARAKSRATSAAANATATSWWGFLVGLHGGALSIVAAQADDCPVAQFATRLGWLTSHF